MCNTEARTLAGICLKKCGLDAMKPRTKSVAAGLCHRVLRNWIQQFRKGERVARRTAGFLIWMEVSLTENESPVAGKAGRRNGSLVHVMCGKITPWEERFWGCWFTAEGQSRGCGWTRLYTQGAQRLGRKDPQEPVTSKDVSGNAFCKLCLWHTAIFILSEYQCPSCLSIISNDLSFHKQLSIWWDMDPVIRIQSMTEL